MFQISDEIRGHCRQLILKVIELLKAGNHVFPHHFLCGYPPFLEHLPQPFGSSIAIYHQLLVTTWKCPRTHHGLLPARFDIHPGSHKCVICKRIVPAGLVKDPAQVVLVSVKAESDCNFAQGLFVILPSLGYLNIAMAAAFRTFAKSSSHVQYPS